MRKDFDGDGNLDVLLVGNDYGTDVSIGRYDASNGQLLKGDGKGNFIPASIIESGWFVPGDAKALVKLRSANGKCLFVASQNKDHLKAFELKKAIQTVPLLPMDVSATILYKNGKKQKKRTQLRIFFIVSVGQIFKY